MAAQTGFIDAPRVMANMAVDSWLPHRFASLSDRLTMRNGIVMIGVAALAMLLYTHGSISALVVMYSINVFVTFSLSEFGMSRFFIKNRSKEANGGRHLTVHADRPDPVPDDSLDHRLREVQRRRLADPGHHVAVDRPVLPDPAALPERENAS